MYNGQNEYVPYKKRTKRSLNDHRMRMRYSSRELSYLSCTCADPESFVRGGGGRVPILTTFFWFLFDEERKDPNTTISGPSTARQRNAI